MALTLANNIKLRSMQLQNLDVRSMDALHDGYVRVGTATQGDDTAGTIFGPVVDGEFLALDSTGKLVRALDTAPLGVKHYYDGKSFLCIAGAGRTDILVTTKLDILYRSTEGFEFDTKVFRGLIATYAINQKLAVCSVSFDATATYKSGVGPIDVAQAGLTTIETTAPVLGIVVAVGSDFIRVRMGY
jgi:hypothetical protein